jgi:hypothetical protein
MILHLLKVYNDLSNPIDPALARRLAEAELENCLARSGWSNERKTIWAPLHRKLDIACDKYLEFATNPNCGRPSHMMTTNLKM